MKRWLEVNKVRQIIDLRTDRPTDGAPYEPGILTDIDYVRVPILQDGSMDTADRSAHYLKVALGHLPAIVNVLRKLSVATECSVVHCYAGVDRTGVVMAMLGELLGVPRPLLLEDYATSGPDLHLHSMEGFLNALNSCGGVLKLTLEAGLDRDTVELLRQRLCLNRNI